MSEKDIIKELRANGPLLFDFEAGLEFQVYNSGILVDSKLDSTKMLSADVKGRML
jgi:hypothetical protein